jgi:hypothetical protein
VEFQPRLNYSSTSGGARVPLGAPKGLLGALGSLGCPAFQTVCEARGVGLLLSLFFRFTTKKNEKQTEQMKTKNNGKACVSSESFLEAINFFGLLLGFFRKTLLALPTAAR